MERLVKNSPYLNGVLNGCRTTMDTSPGMDHTIECETRYRLKRNTLHDAWMRKTISRIVDVLAEAGTPLAESEAYRRVRANGSVWQWDNSCDMAMDEGIVWRHTRNTICLPTKPPAGSPRRDRITDGELSSARMGKMTGDAGEPVPQVMAPKAKTRA